MTQLSDVADVIRLARWLIPLIHVQNHKDDCMYCFSSAYKPNAGHFHGETAEHFWPTGNQLGSQTRQMNAGHCHDTLIDHFGDWNYKKTINLSNALYNDLIHAKQLFDIKFNIFKSISAQYSTFVPDWNLADRSWRPGDKDGSQIYQMLIDDLSSDFPTPAVDGKLSSLSKSKVHFIHEGLLIRLAQLDIKAKVLFYKKENSDALKTDIENARLHLRSHISKWCATQKHVIPRVGDFVVDQSKSSHIATKPEEERLFLPSDLSDIDRATLVPLMLCECERQLLEGQVFDLLCDLWTIVKALTNLLGGISEDDLILRPLTKEDTYCKQTNIKRQVGDTYCHEGLMWANRGPTGGTQPAHLAHGSVGLPLKASTVGMQGKHIAGKRKPQNKKRRRTGNQLSHSSSGEENTPKETKTRKGDHVQWYRTEAEMERWREEWEIKQVEFLRCIRSFGSYSSLWNELAKCNEQVQDMNISSRWMVSMLSNTSTKFMLHESTLFLSYRSHLVVISSIQSLEDQILKSQLFKENLKKWYLKAGRRGHSPSKLKAHCAELENAKTARGTLVIPEHKLYMINSTK
ncbi:hypothetical protein CPB84DRAFT_1750702 [Gymnopilus junonius]|uniref:Uncharacterized protein n=1 Tax=Gymnopilus junonius TaxID=109634 RepID=A0A9P5NH75_GYMJU|nr:hypothetical protein CPB84DRAFT_1750702 [Gymnopilus junonius]